MLNKQQQNKIKNALSWKNLWFFFLFLIIFSSINFYFNEIWDIWFWVFSYAWWISVPYVLFLVLNTILIALSINLIIFKVREIKSLNPWAWIFSLIWTGFALLTWACPGCIAWIFPAFMWVFGSNISLYSLPFHWLELQLLSFVFLIIWVFYLSKDMTCKIKPKKKKVSKKLISIIILSFIATINALYLTYNAYILKASQNTFNIWNLSKPDIWFACDFNSTFSCSSVFTHDFAWIFWIPFSLIALIVYPIIILIAFLWIKNNIKNVYKVLLIMVIWWIIFNWYIIFNEYFVWVYCFLCLICTAIIIAIWGISLAWLKEKTEN